MTPQQGYDPTISNRQGPLLLLLLLLAAVVVVLLLLLPRHGPGP
jgi:hypothetical protein